MMKLYIAGCFLLLGQLISADEVVVINNQTDQAFDNLNKQLTHEGYGSLPLPPVFTRQLRLLQGVLIGFNSFQRIGDAILTTPNETESAHLDLHIGHRLLVPSYGRIQFGDEDITGLTRIRNNSFHLAVSLVSKPICNVTLDHYEWVALGNATFESTDKKYDGLDISEILTDHVLPLSNQQLVREKIIVERKLNEIICRRPGHFSEPEHLSVVFRAAVPSHKFGIQQL